MRTPLRPSPCVSPTIRLTGHASKRSHDAFTLEKSNFALGQLTRAVLSLLARLLCALILWTILCHAAHAFQPDPLAVQSFGAGYRYPQDGWIVVHIEGKPYERGEQHGRLLAPEIAGYIRCLAANYGAKSPSDSWNLIRQLTGAIMLKHYPPELLEEMQGIADGASAAGARIEGRSLDVTDIAAINAANELDLLGDALKATPTGLENFQSARALQPAPTSPATRPKKRPHPTRCSAFAANGKATKDGKIVFGHITMYDLYQANFYNVWLEVKPENGLRFVMQTTPAGVHSGMDFSINSAGILLSETTIQQTAFDASGIPLAVRIRRATQYADSIESAAEILSTNGNGLCSTEWILADIRRNEIALLTLGLKEHKLLRGSKGEWVDGAENFYWSCNNAKDPAVRLETVPGMLARPSTAGVFEPTKRDALWLSLYREHRGAIDADFARKVLTTPALVSAFSVDAVFTTTDLAANFQSWASFGPPVGSVRNPSHMEKSRFPEIVPLVSNPWTLLDSAPPKRPPAAHPDQARAQDLHDPANPSGRELPPPQHREPEPETRPAWQGTLLPLSDADLWLPIAFAQYERIVALEDALKKKAPGGILGPEQWDELGVEIHYNKSVFSLGVGAGKDIPLRSIQQDPGDENWFRIASGKGVLLLHHLRALIGPTRFDPLARSFGREHAGQKVSASAFRDFLESKTSRNLHEFFDAWTGEKGLPQIRLGAVDTRRNAKGWSTRVQVQREKGAGAFVIPITLETNDEEELNSFITVEGPQAFAEIQTDARPVRVTANKYGTAGIENGQPFTILTFDTELEDSLIVYGTLTDAVANLEAARTLQQALRRREHNISVPVKADSEVGDSELRGKHLVLIGRPAANRVLARFAKDAPVHFGAQSFEVRGATYAHPQSAVVFAMQNPLNPRYSMVTIAGLSGLGTLRVVPAFEEETLPYAQAVVLAHAHDTEPLTIAPAALTRELK